MAFIGLRYPVAAPITAETDGAEPTYGTGFVVGKAITANLTITRNDNPLYGDDAICEDDNGITAMSIELGTDDLEDEVQVKLLGIQSVAGTASAPTVYYDTEAASPNVGFGYIRVRRLRGVTSYQANWIYKTMFAQESENSQTKGESIEWQTPTLNGRAMGISLTNPSGITFRKRASFETETAAKAWLKTQANINP